MFAPRIEKGGSPIVIAVAVGDRWVAIDAGLVREVLGRPTLNKLPRASTGLVGVMAWRARAVAVLDLAALLGAGSDVSERARVVVVERGADATAIPVDRVREARMVDAMQPAHGARMPFAAHEVSIEGVLMPLFDVGEWLASLEDG